ncbi:MAG: hypothetical protein FWG26_08400 [Betaproteobacteria bacterium]|nr:hypothetical protein [Betaproteobacteria bacterium]
MESEKHLPMTKARAELEIALLQAEADSMSSSDLYIWLTESGLPSEVAVRFRELIGKVIFVLDITVSIGKIIVIKLIEFVKTHPNMAVGAALGAVISLLVSSIPVWGVGTYRARHGYGCRRNCGTSHGYGASLRRRLGYRNFAGNY